MTELQCCQYVSALYDHPFAPNTHFFFLPSGVDIPIRPFVPSILICLFLALSDHKNSYLQSAKITSDDKDRLSALQNAQSSGLLTHRVQTKHDQERSRQWGCTYSCLFLPSRGQVFGPPSLVTRPDAFFFSGQEAQFCPLLWAVLVLIGFS